MLIFVYVAGSRRKTESGRYVESGDSVRNMESADSVRNMESANSLRNMDSADYVRNMESANIDYLVPNQINPSHHQPKQSHCQSNHYVQTEASSHQVPNQTNHYSPHHRPSPINPPNHHTQSSKIISQNESVSTFLNQAQPRPVHLDRLLIPAHVSPASSTLAKQSAKVSPLTFTKPGSRQMLGPSHNNSQPTLQDVSPAVKSTPTHPLHQHHHLQQQKQGGDPAFQFRISEAPKIRPRPISLHDRPKERRSEHRRSQNLDRHLSLMLTDVTVNRHSPPLFHSSSYVNRSCRDDPVNCPLRNSTVAGEGTLGPLTSSLITREEQFNAPLIAGEEQLTAETVTDGEGLRAPVERLAALAPLERLILTAPVEKLTALAPAERQVALPPLERLTLTAPVTEHQLMTAVKKNLDNKQYLVSSNFSYFFFNRPQLFSKFYSPSKKKKKRICYDFHLNN